MKIELSQEAIDIIKTELINSRERCKYKLGNLNIENNQYYYQYWTKRIEALEKALKELK